MFLKQDLYMHAGKKLISLYPEDKPRLDAIMRAKLAQLGWHAPEANDANALTSASRASQSAPTSEDHP